LEEESLLNLGHFIFGVSRLRKQTVVKDGLSRDLIGTFLNIDQLIVFKPEGLRPLLQMAEVVREPVELPALAQERSYVLLLDQWLELRFDFMGSVVGEEILVGGRITERERVQVVFDGLPKIIKAFLGQAELQVHGEERRVHVEPEGACR